MEYSKAILVAHYNENIDWLKNQKIKTLIYSKTIKEYNFIDENKGQEVPCYIKYIIDSYDNLPEKTLFIHAHKSSIHQDIDTDKIIPILNWNLDSFFSINKRYWYQEISKNISIDFGAYDVWLKNNWHIFENYLPFPEKLKFYSGAQFVVDKKLILQYPKNFWENLYVWIMKTDLSSYISSRIFEYTWHYIFTKNPIEKQYEHNDIFITSPSS
jgi:hypothetical protein